MSFEKHISNLTNTLNCVVEQTKNCIECMNFDELKTKSNFIFTGEENLLSCTGEIKLQLSNVINEMKTGDTQYLNNLLRDIEVKEVNYDRKLETLKQEKQNIQTIALPKLRKKQDNKRSVYLMYKTLFPVDFDYADKNITGFITNKNTQEFHAFELPPDNMKATKAHLWKHMEKLFLK